MVLEGALYDLMQKVGGNQVVNVGSWEVVREWLKYVKVSEAHPTMKDLQRDC